MFDQLIKPAAVDVEDLGIGALLRSSYWRARRYFGQVFNVSDGLLRYDRDRNDDGYEVHGVDLSWLLSIGAREARVLWWQGHRIRAVLMALIPLLQAVIGLVFKAAWLLVQLLNQLVYWGFTDDDWEHNGDLWLERFGDGGDQVSKHP
ncbi:hypothetical protein [Thiorhodococcus fuscus]|uniref:DUF393 domain-containing protein n=1 Tax=Thiorhodococcus fuscus TaxID=527200 RepID=A0ABW4YCM4_9GAMM